MELSQPSSSNVPNFEIGVKQPVQVMLPDSERKHARLQIKGPHDSSSVVQTATALGGTKDQGVDPMTTIYLDLSIEIDPPRAKTTQGTQADETMYLSLPTT